MCDPNPCMKTWLQWWPMAISNILPKPIVARSQELAMAELGFSMTLKMKGYKDSKIPCPMRNAMLSITGKKLISNMKS